MTSPRTKFYRDKKNGKVMGVCAGIADYSGIDPLWIRLITAALIITQGWPLLVYLAIGLFADRKPAQLYSTDKQEQLFWQGVRQSPARTTRDVKSRFREIDRRLADIELYYTSHNRSLSNEIEKLR